MTSRIEIDPARLPAAGGHAWLRLEGWCIALFHADGRYYALDDSCPHQGASLAGGKVVDGKVQCPAHGLRFDLATGCLQNVPTVKVVTYPIHIEEGRVYLSLPGPEATS
ncbi:MULTISPECIES: Rieske 2Fe-2S domain-containing protein [unclassified Duganella]|uniref:Rieske (2Fe-2S) protein n=1 Tax=unclassified Duganella TaxID=2636909 RepID=UPI000E3532FA|nr:MULTISPECIES: Rieske 2Fe-2S domain-containing protein [unclassified Duganella]RFP18743.1 (2Fe-2S)-binding protein [Duganella sp. BJB475]RFP35408.1 (2Fe-2S)-binding protein [Duganella sp. BJB476]